MADHEHTAFGIVGTAMVEYEFEELSEQVRGLAERVSNLQAVLSGHLAGLTPSADIPACRDEDPAQAAVLEACYPEHDSGWPPPWIVRICNDSDRS